MSPLVSTVLLLIALGIASGAHVYNFRNSACDGDAASAKQVLTASTTTWRNNIYGSQKYESIWPSKSANFNIVLKISQQLNISKLLMNLTVKAVDTFSVTLVQNPNGGYISNVKKLDEGTGTKQQKTVQKRMIKFLLRVNSAELDNDVLVLKCPSSKIRFELSPAVNRSISPRNRKEFTFVPESFFFRGNFMPTYNSVPINLYYMEDSDGVFSFVVHGANTFTHELKFQLTDGFVQNVSYVFHAEGRGSPGDIALGYRMQLLLSSLRQVAINENLIQLVASDARAAFLAESHNTTEVAQRPYFVAPRYFVIVPGSYRVNGEEQSFFQIGVKLPIVVRTTEVYPGCLDILIKGRSTIRYQVYFNTVDGRVTQIILDISVFLPATKDMQAAENELVKIIGQTQQIVFKEDGLIQFTKDDGATRITIEPTFGRYLHSKIKPSYFTVISIFGEEQVLLQNDIALLAKPITVQAIEVFPGCISFIIRGYNVMKYQIDYDTDEGWVSSVFLNFTTSYPDGPKNLISAETNLKQIISQTQRITFGEDGLVHFINDISTTRVTMEHDGQLQYGFQPEYYSFVSESYHVNYRRKPLFQNDVELPITVQAIEVYPGVLDITIRGHNTIRYKISFGGSKYFNAASKSVYSVIPGSSTSCPGPEDIIAAETRLMQIIGQTKQIAFEEDGLIYFIKDTGATRVAMKPTYNI